MSAPTILFDTGGGGGLQIEQVRSWLDGEVYTTLSLASIAGEGRMAITPERAREIAAKLTAWANREEATVVGHESGGAK